MDSLAVLLRAREEELSAIYEKVPGIVFHIGVEPNGDFRFLSVSHDFLIATGLTRQQVVGSFVRDVIPPPSRGMVLSHYREAIRTGQPVRWEEESVYPAGRRHGEVAVTPLYDAKGVATHLIGIVHDITDRKRIEEELLKGAKRKDDFLSLLGHEESKKVNERLSRAVRRLLKAHEEERRAIVQELHRYLDRLILVTLGLDRAEQKPSLPPAEAKNEIVSPREQVNDLFNDIRNLSNRLRSPGLEYLGLAITSAKFCMEFSKQNGIQIDFASEDIPQELPNDISLVLFQVMEEALHNAATHSGSHRVQVLLKGGANELDLTIRDWGNGFDPQETLKTEGLGLLIMKERLRVIDGELSVESQPQGGTTIRACVPMRQ